MYYYYSNVSVLELYSEIFFWCVVQGISTAMVTWLERYAAGWLETGMRSKTAYQLTLLLTTLRYAHTKHCM